MVAPRIVKDIIAPIERIFAGTEEKEPVHGANNSFDHKRDILLNSNPAVTAPNSRDFPLPVSCRRTRAKRIQANDAMANNSRILAASWSPSIFSPFWPRAPESSLPI
jgi:hypothetical protein